MERCTSTTKPKTPLMIIQSLQFINFCARKLTLYHIVVINSRILFLLMSLCNSRMRTTSWSMWILIVVLFATLNFLQKLDRSTESGKIFPDTVINPSAFQATINITFHLTNNIPLKTLSFHKTYEIWIQPLCFHSTTALTGIICPISTLTHQPTHLQQT